MSANDNVEPGAVVSLDDQRARRARDVPQVPVPITGEIPPPHLWQGDGACLQQPDADALFFADDYRGTGGQSLKQAQMVCAGCPVRDLCGEYALQENLNFGVWGGLSASRRAKIRRARLRNGSEVAA